MKPDETLKQKTLDANIEVHSKLVKSGEYNKSPHFRKENKEHVKGVIESIISEKLKGHNNLKLLDIGCGTGFIISLVSHHFQEVHGVDITADMMAEIDLSAGNIFLKNALAEATGFPENSFDLVTAYSFLDHVIDYKDVLKEAYKVLTPGGVFYSDLNPNREFSHYLENLDNQTKNLPDVIKREVQSMLHNGEYYEKEFGIDKETLNNAEPEKSINKGFLASEVIKAAKTIGFKEVKIDYCWYLGQGKLINTNTNIDINSVEEYLQMILPASANLYKYLCFKFTK